MSILRVNSITPYTGSLLTINGDIVITGNFTGSSIGDVGVRLTNLESETIALESFTSSFSMSVDSRLDVVEATASLYAPLSTSVNTRLDVVEATASLHIPLSTSVNARLDSVQTYTASVSTSVGVLQSTASLHIPFSTSVDSRLGVVEATASLHIPFSTSVDSRFVGIEDATASLQVSTNALSSVTASYATTGSNVFLGNQTISGSTVITGNLNIFGSASFTTVTSSVILGGNTIQLNTFSPAVRFGGMSVVDSGSTGLTGSLLWDSEKDKWIYSNPSGGAYDSAMLISGPKNTSGIGNELGLVTNYIVKAVGDDHISSSQMQDDGITVTIPYTASIGNIVGLGNPTVFSTSVDSRLVVVEATSSLYIPFSTSVDSRLVSLATTGSNTFIGNQTVTGSVLVDGNVNTLSLRNYNSLFGTPNSTIVNFSVSVATKTSNHRYFGQGSGLGYFIDGIESPFLTLLPGKTYRFTQDDGSNSSHQLRFYIDAARVTSYTTNVTTNGTAGNAGSYTEIVVTDTTPIVLHYQCVNHPYMGNSVAFNSNAASFNNLLDKPTLVSSSQQINNFGIFATTGSNTFIGNQTVTGSVLVDGSINANSLTGSINYNNLTNIPEGIVSGSSQITISSTTGYSDYSSSVATSISASSAAATAAATWTSLSGKPEGIVSGSSQITYSDITDIPTGIISSSNQLTSSYDGRYVLSGSITQTTWDNIASKPDGIVSGSSQITISSTTGFTDYSGSVATSISASSAAATAAATWTSLSGKPEGIVSGSSQVNADSITNFDENVKAKLDADSVVSGSLLGLLPTGVVSGSSQVNADSVTNFDENVKAKLNTDSVVSGSLLGLLPTGVVSGSSQIDVTATTNYNTISSHISNTSNPHSVTANQVGLGNVTNESKATMFSSPTFTGTVSGVTATHVGLGNVTNESKATMFTNAALTGTPTAPTATANTNSTQIATTAYVQQELTDLIGGAPAAFDTLLEISASLAAGDSNLAGLVDGKLSKASNLSDLTDTSAARTNLGVAIGTNVQAYNSTLASVAGGTYSGDDSITTIGTVTVGNVAAILPTGTISGSSQVFSNVSGDVTIASNGVATIAANSVALGTDTTGNYVATITAGSGLSSTGATTGEGIGHTLSIPTNGVTNTMLAGSIGNDKLTNSSITIAGASTALGGTISAATIGNAIGAFSGSSQVQLGSASGNIALATQTTGNYVASLVAGTNITLTNNSGENATPTIGLTSNTISGISLGSNLATLTIGTGLSGTSYNGSTGVTIALPQAVGTTSSVQHGSLGIGMAASGVTGEIKASADIIAYATSDERLKENITPIQDALDKISKISGNTFDWKSGYEEIHSHNGNDVGLIAQEIERVLPQLVTTREHGFKAVQSDKLVALLIEGIKEQQKQIDSLTIEIEKLKELI